MKSDDGELYPGVVALWAQPSPILSTSSASASEKRVPFPSGTWLPQIAGPEGPVEGVDGIKIRGV
jgi:hypothetical protein